MTVFPGSKIIGQATGGSCFQLRTVIRFILSVRISAFKTKVMSDFKLNLLYGGRSPLFPIHRLRFVMAALTLGLVCIVLLPAELQAQTNVTPAAYLASRPKPNFAPNHRLPHLSKWSWPYSYELRVEMASNWGFALELNGDRALEDIEQDLVDNKSVAYKCLQLAKSRPEKYKLAVSVDRFWPYANWPKRLAVSSGFWVTNSNGLFIDNNTNIWQYRTNKLYTAIVSPEGPDSDWQAVAEFTARPLRVIQSNAPIAIVLNGGEYGLGVAGFDQKAWKFDPRVVSARTTNGLSLYRYISNQKVRQLGFMTDAIRAAVPVRDLYVFYNTTSEQSRFVQSGYLNWEDVYANWGWASDVLNAITDLPNYESYYVNGSSWTNVLNVKWSQVTDLLTRHLNGVGYNIKLGKNVNYSWVCAGWGTNASHLSDIPRYMGFLKCLYTSGMVGGVAGYFDYPAGGFNASFPANNPPHWLLQIEALGQVHALFSKFDNILYNGDLLPGPKPHVMSTDQPAYEFPTDDSAVRVLVRKLRGSDQWLIVAWAAAGVDRNVTVTIPNIGTKQLLARASGAVYQANKTNLTMVDINGILPSAFSSPSNLQIKPNGNK